MFHAAESEYILNRVQGFDTLGSEYVIKGVRGNFAVPCWVSKNGTKMFSLLC